MSDDVQKAIFEHLNKKANISPQEIMQVVQSVQTANLSDEKTVRNLVSQLAKMANRPLSKQKEDRIVALVMKNKQSLDIQTLQSMFKN